MKNKLVKLTTILYFGAIWGILEASLGYVLHFVPALISGTIMFPIASVILYRSYKALNSKVALLGVGFIAAVIKSVNFFMPSISIWKTINPMISIVVESLFVLAVISLLDKNNHVAKVVALPIASIGWRGVFLGTLAIQSLLTGFSAPQITSFGSMANFALYYGVISGFIATALFYLNLLWDKQIKFQFKKQPILALPLLALAIVLTIVL
jgi:hypothetical protein